MAFQTLVIVEVDTNDADYVTKQTDITHVEKEVLELLRKLAPALMERRIEHGENWPATDRDWENSDYDLTGRNQDVPTSVITMYPEMSVEELAMFQDLCPSLEGGFHWVESIDILWVERRETLL